MSEGNYTCVNCQLHFNDQTHYKQHYKSEHHRYNVKRKLIGLAPLSLNDYYIQFQAELSSKSQSNSQIYCTVCSKKFMSPQTYKQHINSLKHKNNRKELLYHKDKSESSSVSQFELIDEKKVNEICPFCPHSCTQEHLKKQHCFPPFREECVNVEGLISFVRDRVNKGICIYCEQQFGCKDSAKQHMADSGHAKLDIDCFDDFEPFYLWKISESSEQDEKELETSELKASNSQQSKEFEVLHHKTLAEIEEQRKGRIKYGPTGVTINGKQVGYRVYRNYYKQFLAREVEQAPRENHKALENGDWKASIRSIKAKPQFEKINSCKNHR